MHVAPLGCMAATASRLQAVVRSKPETCFHENCMPKGVRKNITVPGLLATAIKARAAELQFRTLTPFVVDLVTYDLQGGAPHPITVAIAGDTQAAQDAVDAELARRFQPGQPREGLLVQVVQRLDEIRSSARNLTPALLLNAEPIRVVFPARIWQLVEARWMELGYTSLSAYVSGLVRYDLLVGGPHHKKKVDRTRASVEAVARETVARRRSGKRRKLYLDHLIERTEGRPLKDSELDVIKAKIAETLRGLFTAK